MLLKHKETEPKRVSPHRDFMFKEWCVHGHFLAAVDTIPFRKGTEKVFPNSNPAGIPELEKQVRPDKERVKISHNKKKAEPKRGFPGSGFWSSPVAPAATNACCYYLQRRSVQKAPLLH